MLARIRANTKIPRSNAVLFGHDAINRKQNTAQSADLQASKLVAAVQQRNYARLVQYSFLRSTLLLNTRTVNSRRVFLLERRTITKDHSSATKSIILSPAPVINAPSMNDSVVDTSSINRSNTIYYLSLMEDALVFRRVEQVWQFYLALKPRVPITYRIELARLLQRSVDTRSPASYEIATTRLLQLLEEWPAPTITNEMTNGEKRAEIKRVMQARRGCLHAYISTISADDVEKAELLVNDMLLCHSTSTSTTTLASSSKGDDEDDGCRPTTVTLQYLLRLQSILGQPQKCKQWMQRFRHEYNIKADSMCWHWLVNAWMQANQPRNAVTVAINHMRSERVKVFQQTWLVLLEGLYFGLTMEERRQRIPHYDDMERERAAKILLDHLDDICGGDKRYQRVIYANAPRQNAMAVEQSSYHSDFEDTSEWHDSRWRLSTSEYPLNESVLASAMELALIIREKSLAHRFRNRANTIAAQRVFPTDPTAGAHVLSTIALRKEVRYWCYMGNYKAAERAMLRLPLERRYQYKLVSSLMKVARRAGQPAEAIRLFETVRDSGLVRIDAHLWTCLIAAHTDQMDLAAAQKAFYDMWQSGVKAGVVGYTALLVAYGKCGELANAERILQSMNAEETMTTNKLGLEMVDQASSPSEHAITMERAPPPNAVTNCALADAFAKCNEIERTIKILLENNQLTHDTHSATNSLYAMHKVQVSRTFSLNTIMSALNRAGRPQDVLQLWWTAFEGGASSYEKPLHHNYTQNGTANADTANDATRQYRTWNFGTLAITLDTCAWHNLGREGEQVWREATRDLLARQGWCASPPRENGRRIRLTRHCWYSYVGLLGRTNRVRDIPHAVMAMIENGRLPNKPFLLHAFSFLMMAGEEDAIEHITNEVNKLEKRLNAPMDLILPTTDELTSYLQNRRL